MLGLALLAAWRPAQDDWLKERSSTPPVSRTMQALRGALAAEETADAAEEATDAADETAAAADEAADAAPDGSEAAAEAPPSLLDPHAVRASAAAPMTAATCTDFFTVPPEAGSWWCIPVRPGAAPRCRAPLGRQHMTRSRPLGPERRTAPTCYLTVRWRTSCGPG